MKTQKNARERLIRYSILVAVMCVLTFFCSTTIHATVSSKANVDHVEGTSEAKTQDPDSPQDFQFNISVYNHYGYIFYKNHCGASFFAFGAGNADYAA